MMTSLCRLWLVFSSIDRHSVSLHIDGNHMHFMHSEDLSEEICTCCVSPNAK